ncbi:hypothetical protein PAMP_022263 [Pampus punctatissimus]
MIRAALGIWILSAVVCVGRGHHHGGGPSKDKDQADQDTTLDSSDDSVSLVTSANKEFACRMYRKLAAHVDSQGKNIFYSPISVSVALSALSVGARGETHRQLFSGLGFNNSLLTQTVVDQAFRTMFEYANTTSQEDTSEGTAVFVDNHFKPKPEFLHVLKQSYFADGFNVDFTKTLNSTNTINEYVEEKTNGKIDELVKYLDPNTVMYLVSFIYYKGKWATPFDPKLTKEDMFTVDENTKVPVQMMNMEKKFDTYYDQAINTMVLRLPFNSSYSMLLLLPNDMSTLENAISPSLITKWLKWMKSRKYDVYVPKFSIKSSYSLKDVLIEMGMTDIFGDGADLSGISEDGELAVSHVQIETTCYLTHHSFCLFYLPLISLCSVLPPGCAPSHSGCR